MRWILLLLFTLAYAPCSIGFSLPVNKKYRPFITLGLFFLAIGIQVVLLMGILPRAVLV